MKLKIFLVSMMAFQFSISMAQPHIVTDSSVIVIPHWKKTETHKLSIKSSTGEFTDNKRSQSSTGFEVRFTVLDKDTSGYTIEWVYTRAELPADEISIENIILANLLNQKFIIKLTLTGRFKELMNYEEVKSAFDPLIDRLITKSANDEVKNMGFKGVKEMLTNRRNMEIVLLKQIKYYNLSFGYKYKTHFIQTNQLSFPNAMGGKPFDATERIQLLNLDTLNGICVIERISNIDDKELLKSQIFEYLQKNEKLDSMTIQRRFGDTSFEFTEKSTQTLNYLKGIPQKTNFTRVVNFGYENRTSNLSMETIE